jgi:hypothetical protein
MIKLFDSWLMLKVDSRIEGKWARERLVENEGEGCR